MKNLPRITYFDLAELNYASFFLAGLHRLENRGVLRFCVSHGQPQVLNDLVDGDRWKSTLFSVLLFKYEDDDDTFYFCIDTRDGNVTGGSAKGYHLPLLDCVRYYFKVNYHTPSIAADIQLAPHAGKILPLAPFFPISLPKVVPYLPRLGQQGVGLRESISRIRQIHASTRLGDLRSFRKHAKVRDVFFVVEYYEPVPEVNEFRFAIMKELRSRRGIRSDVGFVRSNLPEKYRQYHIERKLSLKRYLSEIASSRVALYVRGVHDCHSFKFSQLLAMGMPIVGQPILNNRESLMQNPDFDVQFAYEDPRSMVDRVEQLIGRPDELARIGESNASVYDRCYTPEAVASDLLERLRSDARMLQPRETSEM